MVNVYNPGKPEGVNSKAQSIKSSLKHVDSEELNRMEEKRRKRKEI